MKRLCEYLFPSRFIWKSSPLCWLPNPIAIMLLLLIYFSFFCRFRHWTFKNNSHSISLSLSRCCLPLPGFRIKNELNSSTDLDSRDRDYPPWSFYRQEIVQYKTFPEGLATSVLTDGVLAHIREERGNGFIPFDQPLDLRKREICSRY